MQLWGLILCIELWCFTRLLSGLRNVFGHIFADQKWCGMYFENILSKTPDDMLFPKTKELTACSSPSHNFSKVWEKRTIANSSILVQFQSNSSSNHIHCYQHLGSKDIISVVDIWLCFCKLDLWGLKIFLNVFRPRRMVEQDELPNRYIQRQCVPESRVTPPKRGTRHSLCTLL
jgi:hypothetical protein